ncbi:ATP-binding protein [Sphingobium sp.]|uniref:ATP-binding protein n=1 Tax=Sphingobium sp. TaxID=1912891 RepID=UPI003BB53CC0
MKERILILAPRGRDALIAADLLGKHDLAADICRDQAGLVTELAAGAGAVLITEEALAAEEPVGIVHWITQQPKWSDMPFVVLANGARTPRTAFATSRLDNLGNVVLLERPLHAQAMLGAIRSALKARQRQYELRDAAATLERAVIDRTQELETARESLAIALDAAGMGGWDINLRTGETRRTARHDEIFGYARLLPQWDVATFLRHVDADQRPAVAAAFDDAMVSGSLEIECSITRVDGQRRFIVARGRVRFDDDGVPTRMAGVVSDVTHQKEADAQLAQAHKMDAIGQLTGGVAHDFNNLLTPIVGNLDLIARRHGDDARTQRLIDGAIQAADRAATLTQRLLSFARRQALQPKAVDIRALIEGIVELIRRSLGPTIAVILDMADDLPSARVDPNQLELALLNLSINARDAMPDGGTLTLTAVLIQTDSSHVSGLEEGRYVRIAAADTGFGMDAATLARAAEPFFSTKGVGRGTGLGLSMAHGLAAQSGGTLLLHSVPDMGTQVELWLPATEEKAINVDWTKAEPVMARHAATVLLVDDEKIVRTATAEMLRDIGYLVTEYGSASHALQALRSGVEADILVTDYLMPGMTGGQLIAEMRGLDAHMPTLLVTGYTAAGTDVPPDVPRLAKPFRQADLAAKVDELLQRERAKHRPAA